MKGFLENLDCLGYHKMLCEEFFAQHAQEHEELEFVALRLADVVGPYDDSFRLWKYVTWMKTLLG